MKNILTTKWNYRLLFTLLMFYQIMPSSNLEAAVRRVGYWGVPLAGIDYATFALAQAASANGDTVYLYKGNYGGISISKQLTIFGTGYLLDSSLAGDNKGNDNEQVFKTPTVGSFDFAAGSNGSKIYGMEGSFSVSANISNIEINRCHITQDYLKIGHNTTNISVLNCLFSSSYSVAAATGSAVTTNLKVQNCISKSMIDILAWYGGSASGEVINNTCGGVLINSLGTFLVYNNIFKQLSGSSTDNANCTFNNNLIRGLASSYNFISGAANVYVPVATFDNPANLVFVGFPSQLTFSADRRFQLASASPALGIGIGGVDAGGYGGTLPYKPSGIPPIPTIYAISSPQGNNPNGNTITINFSTKGNN
jgi:hypothetical protein